MDTVVKAGLVHSGVRRPRLWRHGVYVQLHNQKSFVEMMEFYLGRLGGLVRNMSRQNLTRESSAASLRLCSSFAIALLGFKVL